MYLVQLLVCAFLDFLEGFINFPFKNPYHLYKVVFKVVFLPFSYVGIFRGYDSRILGLWCYYISLVVVDCFLIIGI